MASDSKRIYTLVLVPPATIVDGFRRLSREIGSLVSSRIEISESTLPHITVVQWSDANLDLLRRQLSGVTQQVIGRVGLAGLAVIPGSDGGRWIEVPVLSSSWLRAFQRAALDATKGNGEIVNGIGDRFRPHVTVAFTHDQAIRLPQLSVELLRGESSGWSICLGSSGPYYTLESIISLSGANG